MPLISVTTAVLEPFAIKGAAMQIAGSMNALDLLRALQDYRHARPTTGVIANKVMFKESPSSPEQPFRLGRVWLLRAIDGFKAWEGWSDAAGDYLATGLEVGMEYVPVAVDPVRHFQAAGAGPVVALEPV